MGGAAITSRKNFPPRLPIFSETGSYKKKLTQSVSVIPEPPASTELEDLKNMVVRGDFSYGC